MIKSGPIRNGLTVAIEGTFYIILGGLLLALPIGIGSALLIP